MLLQDPKFTEPFKPKPIGESDAPKSLLSLSSVPAQNVSIESDGVCSFPVGPCVKNIVFVYRLNYFMSQFQATFEGSRQIQCIYYWIPNRLLGMMENVTRNPLHGLTKKISRDLISIFCQKIQIRCKSNPQEPTGKQHRPSCSAHKKWKHLFTFLL